MILDTQVLGSNDEASTVLPAVANIEESFGQSPDASAALRDDPTLPVFPELRNALPVNPQNKVLDKSAFTYDPAKIRLKAAASSAPAAAIASG